MSTRIFRYEVPVDDEWHEINLQFDPLSVDCRALDVVEFWAFDEPFGPPKTQRRFRVFGTGQVLPEDEPCSYVGTAIAPGGQLVWHLMEAR